jgi:hypothetical protein
MKPAVYALALAAVCFTANAAFAATTDDVKWINKCVSDNKGDASADVVLKYCTCMNNKMSDNETPAGASAPFPLIRALTEIRGAPRQT